MSKLHVLLPLGLLALASCETIAPLMPPPPEELDLWDDAAAGVTDTELAELCREVWEDELRLDPFRATLLGDPRYNGKIPDQSLEGELFRERMLRDHLHDLRIIESGSLLPEDRLTAALLREHLEQQLVALELDLEEWNVDPLYGPEVELLTLATLQPHRTQRERQQLVERWRAFPSYLRDHSRNLQRGRSGGRVASRTAIEKTVRQLDEILSVQPHLSPLVAAAAGEGRWVDLPPGGNVAALAHEHLGDSREQTVLVKLNQHLRDPHRIEVGAPVLLPWAGDPLTIEERGEFLADVLAAVEDGIYPALAAYRQLLNDRLLPVARDDDHAGLKYLAGGAETYRRLVQQHTTLPEAECSPKKIHDYGLAEVARIRAEIAALGQKVLGTGDVNVIQARLRRDPALHFETREQVEATARLAMARARANLRGWFGIVPLTPCEVLPTPAFEEENSTIAYYREPSADGSRPGRYYVNTFAPETRPRYEAEVLAFHEAVPGHHLQIAIAQEREDLPRFRRHYDCTAYAEGWALYTERLCDEMGLYSSDLDRLGMLSFDAWRASRLVVDTGLHFFGWSRDQAIDYLWQNTLLARNNIENEVDRYIAWPGQALAYKLGQRELLALRDESRAALGAHFRYPDFHDRVLESGPVTLSALRARVRGWSGARQPVEASSPEGR